jgi:hypothetical protein
MKCSKCKKEAEYYYTSEEGKKKILLCKEDAFKIIKEKNLAFLPKLR